MFETILVPLDGSKLAEAALPLAREIQQKFGSRVVLVRAIASVAHHIAQQSALYETPAAAAANVDLITQVVEEEKREAAEYLSQLAGRESWLASGDQAVIEGEAADAIRDVATEKQAGLIIMSSHGRGGLGRLVFGSIADRVLRESKVPVLLLRSDPEHEK